MFEFPKAKRSDLKKYNKNYLKSVIFQVKFENTEEISKNREKITSLFKDLLPRSRDTRAGSIKISFNDEQTPIIQSDHNKSSGFELRSKDGGTIFSFSNDTVSLTISGIVYNNFSDIEEKISMLNDVFKISKIKSFNRVAIRKINIIDFEKAEKNKTSSFQIMELILNPSLIRNVAYFPQPNYIQQSIHTINYTKEENKLNLRYGLIVPEINSPIGQILVDIDLFTTNNVKVKSLKKISHEINNEIFNIFNWSISEEAIKQLKQ